MDLLFSIVFFIWIGSEITLSSLKREKRASSENSDRNTLRTIWIVTVSAISIAAVVTWLTSFPIVSVPEFRYAGIAVMVTGLVVRIAAIMSLGQMFTYNVAIREGHALHTSGLYRFVRHPSYTGMLVTFAGYGLALNNWLGLALAFIPVFAVMVKRIAVEERVLTEQFGDAYRTYKQRTWRLIPRVF
jgi:protein-S-isoprenylcysteine O-methyltransferase Ste14